ncbi:unnamed protein product [Peronospora belbahrii]|uniref:Uncharacterized protein n=2 Tax=Peronospora belbahrii TaxID=622444 RepID=A0AAU9KWD6_9STRA|nr:unnamed protein product [Peronospora belbahrii]
MRVLKNSGAFRFDPGRAVRNALRIFLDSKELGMVVDALDHLESNEIPIRSSEYENMFSTTTKTTGNDGKLYTADDFMLVWNDMIRRSIPPSKAILRLVIPVMCGGMGVSVNNSDDWKCMKLSALRGYHQAVEDHHDNYVLPVPCFSMLLEAAVEQGSIEDVNAVYAGAVKTLGAFMNKKHYTTVLLNTVT